MKKVVLDPGHGGPDPGAIGPTGVQEKVVSLAIARKVSEILAPVAQVKLTRERDEALGFNTTADLEARARIANEFGADCFISIHCNAAKDPKAQGTETYHFPGSGLGRKLAQAIQARLVSELQRPDRGVKEARYLVLRETRIPACLVELAFISNPTEEALLENPDFQAWTALAIAQGVADFLGVQLPDKQIPAPADSPAKDTVKVIAGGKTMEGVLINGTTYAPVRDLAQALGKKVRWVQEQKTVVVE